MSGFCGFATDSVDVNDMPGPLAYWRKRWIDDAADVAYSISDKKSMANHAHSLFGNKITTLHLAALDFAVDFILGVAVVIDLNL
jgi:hypothetical protein